LLLPPLPAASGAAAQWTPTLERKAFEGGRRNESSFDEHTRSTVWTLHSPESNCWDGLFAHRWNKGSAFCLRSIQCEELGECSLLFCEYGELA
jgi:hypothetical protein